MPLACLGVCFLLLLMSFLLGHFLYGRLLFRWTENDTLSTFFFTGFLGFGTLTVCYSLLFKGCSSSLFPCFVLLFYMAIKGYHFHLPRFSNAFFPFALVFLVWVAYFNYVTQAHQDLLFYAILAKSLSIFREENYFLVHNLISASFSGYTPYHYGELWISNAISWASGIPHVQSLHFVVYSILSFFVWLGVSSLFAASFPSWKRLLIGFLVLFFTVNAYSFAQSFLPSGFPMYVFNLLEPAFFKTLFFQPMALAASWWIRRNKQMALLWLCQAPLCSFVTAPAIFGGILIWLLFLSFQKSQSQVELKSLWLIWLLHIVALLSVTTWNVSPKVMTWSMRDLIQFYLDRLSFSLHTFCNIVLGQALFVLFSSIPLLAAFFWIKPNTISFHPLFLIVSVPLAGIGAFALFFPVKDAVQLSYVSWIGIGFPLLLHLFSYVNAVPKRGVWLGVAGSISILFLQFPVKSSLSDDYSVSYLKALSLHFQTEGIPKIGSIKKPVDLHSYSQHTHPIRNFAFLPHFVGCIPMTMPIQLDPDPITQFRSIEIGQESSFFSYLQEKKGTFWGLGKTEWEEACCTFVEEHQLDGIVVEKGADIPPCLSHQIKKTLFDPVSGEKCLLLKK